MNERVNEYEPPRSNWFKEHPSATLTLIGVVCAGVIWGSDVRRRELDRPQWASIHTQLDGIKEESEARHRDLRQESKARHRDLRQENRHMATWSLERGRYTDEMLLRIAKAAGVRAEQRPTELDRSELRVRDISERDD